MDLKILLSSGSLHLETWYLVPWHLALCTLALGTNQALNVESTLTQEAHPNHSNSQYGNERRARDEANTRTCHTPEKHADIGLKQGYWDFFDRLGFRWNLAQGFFGDARLWIYHPNTIYSKKTGSQVILKLFVGLVLSLRSWDLWPRLHTVSQWVSAKLGMILKALGLIFQRKYTEGEFMLLASRSFWHIPWKDWQSLKKISFSDSERRLRQLLDLVWDRDTETVT